MSRLKITLLADVMLGIIMGTMERGENLKNLELVPSLNDLFFSNIPIMLSKLDLGAIFYILKLFILIIFSLTTNQQILDIQFFMRVSTQRYHLSKYLELLKYRNCSDSGRYCFISLK